MPAVRRHAARSTSISRRRRRRTRRCSRSTGGQPGADRSTGRASTPAVITDLLGYQVLCNRGGDLQVFSDGTFQPGFQSCSRTSTPDVRGVQGLTRSSPARRCWRRRRDRIASRSCRTTSPTAWRSSPSISSGNPSTPDIFYGDPTKTKSFYDVYRNDADRDQAGAATGGLCTLGAGRPRAAPRPAWARALALAAIVLARRRRGRAGEARAASRWRCWPALGVRRPTARAQTFATDASALGGRDRRAHNRYKTPQRFAFELRFGPYTPDVDSEFDGARHPYQDYFGSAPAPAHPDRVRLRDLPSLRHRRARRRASAISRCRQPRRSPAAPASRAATSRR